MKHFFFSLFLMLFAGTMSCQAYSKQLIKANKALLALEKNANASLKDHQIVVDQLSAVINTTKDIDDKCEASLELAEAYSVHVPVQFRDYAKAADYYKKALELICENYNSDADDERETVKKLKYRAFYNTAYYCYYKNSPTQDLGKALDYFVEAAEYNPSANSQVGEIYEFGVGCDIDPDMAMEAYTEAIINGSDYYAKYYSTEYFVNQVSNDALDTIAFNNFKEGILQHSMGMERLDYDKMKKCLTVAAERGYVPAQFELGTRYKNGYFPEISSSDKMKLAEEWLKKAADAGYVPAIHNLGYLYEIGSKGTATSESRIKAFPYYERAAIEGFPPSQCALAVYYYMGYGEKKKDYDAAEFWLESSANKGYKLAKQYLDNLRSEKERAQQIIEARKNVTLEEVLNRLSNSLNSLANTIANVSSKRSKMTSAQVNTMQRASYSNGRQQTGTASTNRTVDEAALTKKAYERRKNVMDNAHVQTERRVYENYEDMLKRMYWGESTYSDRDREKYQDKMRDIRQKWEAKGFKICFSNGGRSEWETWDGKCKYSKK